MNRYTVLEVGTKRQCRIVGRYKSLGEARRVAIDQANKHNSEFDVVDCILKIKGRQEMWSN